ncbi:hypothetical protein QQS21_001211 [Conoideocrella luteorostrata]|uniref:RRM domain-containing protein n=1 Tax=Conoideocrella luteorostrata TaxID=1105319 RepID=A0AAJ0CXI8_9HYPO|nr:hypothetical protein QQS21_001211 [Conoideocrella luteorostrata]
MQSMLGPPPHLVALIEENRRRKAQRHDQGAKPNTHGCLAEHSHQSRVERPRSILAQEQDSPRPNHALLFREIAARLKQALTAPPSPIMEVTDGCKLTTLSSYFYEMQILLERINRDLGQFSLKHKKATQFVNDNDELPGTLVLATLNATLPLMHASVQRNTAAVETFRGKLCDMKQALEGEQDSECESVCEDAEDEELSGTTSWTAESHVNAWNNALFCDEEFIMNDVEGEEDMDQYLDDLYDEGGMNDYLDELNDEGGMDNYVDEHNATRRRLSLHYHQDMTELDSPPVSMPLPSDDSEPNSRCVLMNKLPPDATVMQLMGGIRSPGGIISITLANDLSSKATLHKTALVEFRNKPWAEGWVDEVQRQHLFYRNSSGDSYQVRPNLIPTDSSAGGSNFELLQVNATRLICMPLFPDDAIWYVLCQLGMGFINNVRFDHKKNLFIEFTNLFEADKALRRIRDGDINVNYYGKESTHHVKDSSFGSMEDIYASTDGIIPFVDPDIFEKTWNKAPYNTFRPHDAPVLVDKSPGIADPPSPSPPPVPTRQELIAEDFGIEPEQVDDFLEERNRDFKPTTYRVMGSNIKITRDKYSWTTTVEDGIKLWMAASLHDPREDWDSWFRVHNMINVRTWEAYGMLARHRRELAKEQGLEEGAIPRCGNRNCEFGCREWKDTPVPKFIRDWCKKRRSEDEGDDLEEEVEERELED